LRGVTGAANGVGANARFNQPTDIAIDSAGTLFVADYLNNAVRKIEGNTVTTLAAVAAFGLTVAGDSVYAADIDTSLVRRIIKATGAVTTVGGLAIEAGYTDGSGPAARFQNPNDLAVDSHGNVFVADSDNNVIRKIAPNGDATTFAGSGAVGVSDGTGTAAEFSQPNGIAIDGADNLYVVHSGLVRKITPAGVVSTISEIGNYYLGLGQFDRIAVNPAGDVFLQMGGRIDLWPAPAGTVTPIIVVDLPATITALTTDHAGYLYYIQGGTELIRFDPLTQNSSIALLSTSLSFVSDLDVDTNGAFYAVDSSGATVSRFMLSRPTRGNTAATTRSIALNRKSLL